jgi:hypothetical protein
MHGGREGGKDGGGREVGMEGAGMEGRRMVGMVEGGGGGDEGGRWMKWRGVAGMQVEGRRVWRRCMEGVRMEEGRGGEGRGME